MPLTDGLCCVTDRGGITDTRLVSAGPPCPVRPPSAGPLLALLVQVVVPPRVPPPVRRCHLILDPHPLSPHGPTERHHLEFPGNAPPNLCL